MSEPANKTGAVAMPFRADRLDALMDAAGLDVLLVTSKHNIQYLTGGYRFYFMEYLDAIGTSRYLPALVYFKGNPDGAFYVGNRNEIDAIAAFNETASVPFWVAERALDCWGTRDAMEHVASRLKRAGKRPLRAGAELGFLPADALQFLKSAVPDCTVIDALVPLERLRAIKTPAELDLLRTASKLVVDSMLAAVAGLRPGVTTREIADRVRLEEQKRGLIFEYCLTTPGPSLKRAPSGATWDRGQPLSLDSGGNYRGYIGDLARMAVLGEPDAELVDLLAEIDTVQQAARRAMIIGYPCGDVHAAGMEARSRSPHGNHMDYLVHGMGLINHEAPRITSGGPIGYEPADNQTPLEAGMVVSIETTIRHPRRGFIKLEDTVAMTTNGPEGFGDHGRGWNIVAA